MSCDTCQVGKIQNVRFGGLALLWRVKEGFLGDVTCELATEGCVGMNEVKRWRGLSRPWEMHLQRWEEHGGLRNWKVASVGGAWLGCGGEAEESRAFWNGFSHQWLPLVRLKSLTSSLSPTLSIPLILSTLLRYFAKIPPSWWRWGLFPRRKRDKRLDRWGTPLWSSVLRLQASTSGGMGSIPGLGTKISHAMQPNKKTTWMG